MKEWIPVSGTSDEVFCFSYLLDIGDIQKPFDSQYRQDLILSMYAQSGWDNSPEYIHKLSKDIRAGFAEYDRLLERLQKGSPVRIWYSHAAYSFCGLHWICSQMQNQENDIYVVELPEHNEIPEKHAVIEYRNWGEVPAGVSEEFYDYWILKTLTGEPIKEARLIGGILGRYPASVSDWWYAARIEQMVKDGRIKVLLDSKEKYRRTICLA